MTPLARSRRRLRRAEWPMLALALLALVVWLSPPQRLERLNHLVQDAGHACTSAAHSRTSP